MGSVQAASQNDVFYDLLSNSTSALNGGGQQKKRDLVETRVSSPVVDFGNEEVQPPRYDVQPSYDFQPSASALGNSKITAFSSGNLSSSLRPPLTSEPTVHYEKEVIENATLVAVERTMKKYADNLLHVLEGISGRLTHLESTTQRLEHMVTEFKGGADENSGATDGKLRALGNMLSEVQRSVQVLRDRQELAEAHSQLAKLQLSVREGAPSAPVATQAPEPPPQSPPPPRHSDALPQQQGQSTSRHNPPLPTPPPHMLPQQPSPPPLPQQLQLQAPPAVQPEPQYQQQSPQPPPPHSMSFYSQPPPPPPPPPPQQQQGPPPSLQQQYSHPPEAPPYGTHPQGPHQGPPPPSANYADLPPQFMPFGNRPFPQQQPPPMQTLQPQAGSGGPPMYDTQAGGSSSSSMGLPPPYHSQGRPAVPNYDQQQMNAPAGYGSPAYHRMPQPAVPSAPSSGNGGYPRLPTAQPVQHALPTATATGPGPSGPAPLSTNRVPIDEIIEKVSSMGFSKDQVRAVVRRLTENGQSVDLNIVLDKLMNGGADVQPQKGWFGRG
jgi:hypothetical protein